MIVLFVSILAIGVFLILFLRTERRRLSRIYHSWAKQPTLLDAYSAHRNYVLSQGIGLSKTFFEGREVLPGDWNKKVDAFRKEHWADAAEREIKARGGKNDDILL